MSKAPNAHQVLDRVNRIHDQSAAWRTYSNDMRRMWRLDAGYNRSLQEAVAAGQEQITTSTPYDEVNLAMRLVSTIPKIDVEPFKVGKEESEEAAELTEKWLTYLIDQVNYYARRNVTVDAWLYQFIDGRHAWDVRYIEQALPKTMRGSQLPLLIRAPDPQTVGIHMGDLYPEFAYHRYESPLIDVVQRWGNIWKPESDNLREQLRRYEDSEGADEPVEVTIVDYWYRSPRDGTICNAVLCEDEFIKPPIDTLYPDIPIIVGRGDYAPGLGSDMDGLSLLHPLRGQWEYECRLHSQMATMVMHDAWPIRLLSNDEGNSVEDINIGPGKTTPVPPGTKLDVIQSGANVQLIQAMMQKVEQNIQRALFPEVLYGKAPGDLQAGYGVSLLADAAKGRIKNYLEGMELSMAHLFSTVLGIIDKVAPAKGVTIWGRENDEKFSITLSKKQIKGNYGVKVSLTPTVLQDEQTRATLGMRMAEAGLLSRRTFWGGKWIGSMVAGDEAKRIALEEAMLSDELRPNRLRAAILEYYPKESAFKLLAEANLLPPGYHVMPDGSIMKDSEMPQEPPGGMPPGPPPPMMPPEGMMPPPEGMAPGGIPPLPGAPPPAVPPPMPEAMGAPPNPLGGIMPQGMPIQPDAMLTGPMGGGIPPEMQGQLTPEMLGLPPDIPPEVFAQLMNRPLSPEEELQALQGGLQPPPMI